MTTRRMLLVALTLLVAVDAAAQEPPLVYEVEHTGAKFPMPVLPEFAKLPIVRPLPDRSTALADWSRRRAEIKAEIEHYGIGKKPPCPEEIEASFKDGTLTVQVTENGESLTLTANIQRHEGDGPFPAAIGIGFGGGSGSLPPDIFADRKIATIAFDFTQVMSHT